MLRQILMGLVMMQVCLACNAAPGEGQEFYDASKIVDEIDGHPVTDDGKVVVEVNEAGEMVTIDLEKYLESKGANFLSLVGNYFDFKKTFQTVTSYITPLMEKRFELFVIVNVDYRDMGYGADKIPSQHMRIVRRAYGGQKIFERDASGQITGVSPETLGGGASSAFDCLEGNERGMIEADGLIKISSGKGKTYSYTPKSVDAYLDTPTGLYRFNDQRNSLGYRGKNEHGTRVMWTPIYFDLHYPWGRSDKKPLGAESALAMHGTSNSAYRHLGSQASHGCIRTHKKVSQCVKKQFHTIKDNWRYDSGNGGPLIQKALHSNVPYLDSRVRLKSEMYDEMGRLYIKEGTPAMFIIFYGYNEDLETGEIREI